MTSATTYYQQQDHLLVALDCIIFGFEDNELKLLLIKRDFEPERGRWSLMGGFLRRQESLNDAARRILRQLTGLEDVYLEQLHTFGSVDRDPVERTLSVAYYSLINVQKHNTQLVREHGARWFSISQLPEVIFDHADMIAAAQEQLRYKAAHQPVGFELLPDKFTMPQLRTLYEAIYEQPIDPRNFTRRILSMDVLIKLDEKQRGYSRKGAWYYRFDTQKYRKLLREGANFLLKP